MGLQGRSWSVLEVCPWERNAETEMGPMVDMIQRTIDMPLIPPSLVVPVHVHVAFVNAFSWCSRCHWSRS